MNARKSGPGIGFHGGVLVLLVGTACGGPDEEFVGETEDQLTTVDAIRECRNASVADQTFDRWALCHDPLISPVFKDFFCQSSPAPTACTHQYAVHRCYDPNHDRHIESLGHSGCWTQPWFPPPANEDVFYFALSPQVGADARPIFRCGKGGNDRPSRSPTCDDWNKAPVSKHGYSYAPGRPGTTPVYRCKRNRAPNDWFLSRQANCEGHIRQELLGYATLEPSL